MLSFLLLMIASSGAPSDTIITNPHHPLNTAFSRCAKRTSKKLIAMRADHLTVYETIEKRCDIQLHAIYEEVRRVNAVAGVDGGDARINAGDTVSLILQDKVDAIDEKIAKNIENQHRKSKKSSVLN
jgi:hypothetical protein